MGNSVDKQTWANEPPGNSRKRGGLRTQNLDTWGFDRITQEKKKKHEAVELKNSKGGGSWERGGGGNNSKVLGWGLCAEANEGELRHKEK